MTTTDRTGLAPLLDPTAHFTHAVAAHPERLHLAAHSHHPWPDVTRAAHLAAWDDAATWLDDKWREVVFGLVVPTAQRHLAHRLGLPDPAGIAVAANTHELVTRALSDLPAHARVLTTDAEFHSAARQLARWEEAGRAEVVRVAAEPLATLDERLVAAAAAGDYDALVVSHVLFDSGAVVDVDAVVAAAPPEPLIVVDAYHAAFARPVDYASIAARAFVTSAGYKYAMAGEGAGWMWCPPGWVPRPVDTGWFAAFGAVVHGDGSPNDDAGVAYAPGGMRFAGATLDPTGLYRFNAVQAWLAELGVGVADLLDHVRALQSALLARLDDAGVDDLSSATLVPEPGAERGWFLTFRSPRAGAWRAALASRGVVVDHRGDRLRVGLGGYHGSADVGRFAAIVRAIGQPT